MNYRTPSETTAEYERKAARYERLGMPRNAECCREIASDSRSLAARIAVLLSVEQEQGR